ncbi:MAG: nuclear transport factor 2 family protein [Gammaproteobacteria bacterium]|nr:nuclear transport factor 2 family protein [Gammaproteobacteria bacterium]
MSIEDNKALVTRFWQTFSAGQYDEAVAMLADDATWWVAGATALSRTYSKAEFAELLSQVTPMAPKGLSVTPSALCAEGDRVSVEAVSYGEFNNGRVYKNEYHFMMVIRDGKFVSVREYLDTEHVTATFAP